MNNFEDQLRRSDAANKFWDGEIAKVQSKLDAAESRLSVLRASLVQLREEMRQSVQFTVGETHHYYCLADKWQAEIDRLIGDMT